MKPYLQGYRDGYEQGHRDGFNISRATQENLFPPEIYPERGKGRYAKGYSIGHVEGFDKGYQAYHVALRHCKAITD